MGERGLTRKQQHFAVLVAGGSSKAAAFRTAYPSAAGRATSTEWQGGKKIARLPKVAAEVRRLSLLQNPAAQAEIVMARLLGLIQDPNSGTAMKAIAQWEKLVAAGLLKPPAATRDTEPAVDCDAQKDRVIDELMTLLAEETQHQAASLLPLRPEVEQVIDVESEELAPESEVEALSAQSLLPPAQDGAAQPVLPDAPEDDVVYVWQNVPGFFGKQRRQRVRIR
jgi:hypothetical protein